MLAGPYVSARARTRPTFLPLKAEVLLGGGQGLSPRSSVSSPSLGGALFPSSARVVNGPAPARRVRATVAAANSEFGAVFLFCCCWDCWDIMFALTAPSP